jgi:hypothetical protein
MKLRCPSGHDSPFTQDKYNPGGGFDGYLFTCHTCGRKFYSVERVDKHYSVHDVDRQHPGFARFARIGELDGDWRGSEIMFVDDD